MQFLNYFSVWTLFYISLFICCSTAHSFTAIRSFWNYSQVNSHPITLNNFLPTSNFLTSPSCIPRSLGNILKSVYFRLGIWPLITSLCCKNGMLIPTFHLHFFAQENFFLFFFSAVISALFKDFDEKISSNSSNPSKLYWPDLPYPQDC